MCAAMAWSRETADDVVESVRGRVHVGIVNLIRVAGKDDLCAVADARDDGLGFERREVLRSSMTMNWFAMLRPRM